MKILSLFEAPNMESIDIVYDIYIVDDICSSHVLDDAGVGFKENTQIFFLLLNRLNIKQ